MSLDINELVKAVKQAAVEAVRAEAPVAVCYGTVTSASPLKIQVDQKKDPDRPPTHPHRQRAGLQCGDVHH